MIDSQINIYDTLYTNYIPFFIMILTVSILSYPNITNGIISFLVIMFLAYIVHLSSHMFCNIFTCLHHYHHDNNNLFAYISQIILELSFIGFLYITSIFLHIPVDIWIIIFSVLLYSSIHNINYGVFKINNVHYLHHQNKFTNIGPDIFDILFHTKHPKDTTSENISHYIPNMLILFVIISIMKFSYMHTNEKNQANIKNIAYLCGGASAFFLIISSLYIYLTIPIRVEINPFQYLV